MKAQALKTYLSYGEQKGLKEKKVIIASKVEKFAVQNWPFFEILKTWELVISWNDGLLCVIIHHERLLS